MPNIKETISQVLSPTNATYVNGVSVRRVFSKAILKAVYQGLVEKDGRGVNGKFITEAEANDAGQVFVNRVKAHFQMGRQHGAAKNGGAFNNNGYMSRTETVGIKVLEYFDEPIIVARVTQDRIDVDLASTEIANYVASINTALNGSSWAAKFFATYGADKADRNEMVISSTDISNKLALSKFQEANSLLDEGDLDHDIDYFDLETRIATFKVGYRTVLTSGGVLLLGGANYAYDIVRQGTLDAETKKRDLDNGHWGEIDNVPVHGLSNMSLKYAAWFCGMPEMEFAKGSHLMGWISSSLANARGFSTVDQVKIIDAHGGQGIEIQPLTKIGAVAWYPKGNVAIVSKEGYDPIADLKTLFTGLPIEFDLKSGGSRYYSEDLAVSAISTSAFTASGTGKDDRGVDHIKGAYYVVSSSPITTVADFLDVAKADGTEGGTFTLGVSKSFSATQDAGDYVTVLVIADDGTCSLVSKIIA